jgi:hypothetical protein
MFWRNDVLTWETGVRAALAGDPGTASKKCRSCAAIRPEKSEQV